MLLRIQDQEHGDASAEPLNEDSVQAEMYAGDTEEDKDKLTCSYISTLIAGVCTMFDFTVKFSKARCSDLSSLLMSGISKFAFTANQLFTFVKNNLLVIKRIGEWLFSDHPSVKSLGILKEKHEVLYAWAKDVWEITDPRKECKVFTSVRLATQVYKLAAQANLIIIKILQLKLDAKQTSTIHLLVKKICDLRDRLAKLHTAPPVRFEPFVLELTGPTGVGKSRLMRELPNVIFKRMGFKHDGELTYFRANGNPYWNGLQNQPCLVIDEKFPVKGTNFLDLQLAELFQLKSTCIFNPLMADIPDKNIRYNPLIVIYGSNTPFPGIDTQVLDMNAVNRRRDLLVDVRMHEVLRVEKGYNAKIDDFRDNPERLGDLSKFQHLQFTVFKNVLVGDIKDNFKTIDNKVHLNYNEFIDYLIEQFTYYYMKENKAYRAELDKIQDVLPEEGEKSITDIFGPDWFDELCRNPVQDHETLKMRKMYCWLNMHYPQLSSKEESDAMMQKGLSIIIKICHGDLNDEAWKGFQHELAQLEAAAKDNKVKKSNNNEISKATVRPSITKFVPNISASADGDDGSTVLMSETAVASGSKWVPPCPHDLMDAVMGMSSVFDSMEFEPVGEYIKFEMNEKTLSFIADTPLLGSGRSIDWQADLEKAIKEFKEIFNEYEYYQENNKHYFKIYYNKCYKGVGCRSTSDAKERKKWFYSTYIVKSNKLKVNLLAGDNMTGELPNEYIDSIRGKTFDSQLKEHLETEKEMPEIKGFFANLKDKFYKIEWRKWLKRIGIALAVVSFFGIAIRLWKQWQSTEDTSMGAYPALALCGSKIAYTGYALDDLNEAQGHVSGDVKSLKTQSKLTAPAVKSIGKMSNPQAQMGVNGVISLERKLRRNTCFLSVSSGTFDFSGRCLGICGNYLLTMYHFYEAWKKTIDATGNDTIMLSFCQDMRLSVINLKFSSIKLIPIEGKTSLCLLKLPNNIQRFADIRKRIATSSDHKNLNLKAKMYEMCYEVKTGFVIPNYYSLVLQTFSGLNVNGTKMWSQFDVHDGYSYSGFSGAGKCGSVLLAEGQESPIIGMHFAGYSTTGTGFSEVLTREMFNNLENGPEPMIADAQGMVSQHFVDAEVIGIGRVPPRFAHKESGKSRIIPSKLQKIDEGQNFPILTQPAVLSKTDNRIKDNPFSPMHEGCKYHGKPLLPFNQQDLEIAKQDLRATILAHCKPQRKVGRLSVDQAVGGIDGLENYDSLKFSTSEGYPFVGLRPYDANNKRWLFNFDEYKGSLKYKSTKQILLNALNIKWQQRNENIIPFTVFTDCLKDTTIENDKVFLPGKTRIFSMSPVDFTIHQRQCTLDFVAAYMHCRFNLEHMIGCNPDSVEWTKLATQLLRHESIITGDYSKFGDTIPFEFIKIAFEIIEDWYKFNGCTDEELFNQLKIFPYEIGQSVHLMMDHLYQCVCGQPSGNALTVIINSLANSLYLRVAWLDIMRHTAYNSLADFHKLLVLFSYGDDIIASVSDLVKDLFNARTLCEFFAKYNLKFTNASKSATIVPYTSLGEADFLKRSFIPHPNSNTCLPLVLAPLDVESIEDTPNWIWGEAHGKNDFDSPVYQQMSIQVCEDSIRNAFGRGPNYYKNWCNKLEKFWLSQGVTLRFDTWEQMDFKIFVLGLNMSPYYGSTSYESNNQIKS